MRRSTPWAWNCARARHLRAGRQGLALDADDVDSAGRRGPEVVSPVSLVVTAFASLPDVRGTLTPNSLGGRP